MMALAFSGGKDSLACLHLMRDQLDCGIFVDTGFCYPETIALVNEAASLIPMHVVQSDRRGQNERLGIPADVVPVDWTVAGQWYFGSKPVKIQPYLLCHWENVWRPLLIQAHALGVTCLIIGARHDDGLPIARLEAEKVEGITYRYPLKDWTAADVLRYLETKMKVPEHFYAVHDSSSLDCYDCTAFEAQSRNRLAWTSAKHPAAYAAYAVRRQALDHALHKALMPHSIDPLPVPTKGPLHGEV